MAKYKCLKAVDYGKKSIPYEAGEFIILDGTKDKKIIGQLLRRKAIEAVNKRSRNQEAENIKKLPPQVIENASDKE